MWAWMVACGALTAPSPADLATGATMAPSVGHDGVITVARPSRLGAVAVWRGRVVWTVPQGVLGVPVAGGATEVLATLPEDCWPSALAVADGALFAPCGGTLLRIDHAVKTVLQGDFVYGVAAGHGGVTTCRGTRVVRVRADGATHETLADLGVVPHELEGGPSVAACVGAEVITAGEGVLVRHGSWVWRVPRLGGDARIVARAPLVLASGDRVLTHDRRDGRWVWAEGDRVWLETGLPAPCAAIDQDTLVSCVRRGEQMDLVRLDLSGAPTAAAAETLARGLGPVPFLTADDGVIAWVEGTAPEGGIVRLLGRSRREKVH